MEPTKKSFGELKFWHLRIEWLRIRHQFGMGFTQPPTREDIEFIIRREWQKLPEEKQDQVWEVILILDHVPIRPWLGRIETIYGNLECCERFLVCNGPIEPPVPPVHQVDSGGGSTDSSGVGEDPTRVAR